MADVFISYARPDRGVIEHLAGVLRAEGYSVWWDHQIKPGAEFSRDIERELNAARVVVVAWSVHANDSPWVKDEAAVARDQGKLVPLRLDANMAPMGFRQYQSLDFTGWKGEPGAPAISSLLTAVASHVSGEERQHAAITASAPAPGRSRPGVKWLGTVVVALLLAYVVFSPLQFSFKPPFISLPESAEPTSQAAAGTGIESEPWIAVNPIRVQGKDPGLPILAEALTDGITSGLSRFSYLLVASKAATDTRLQITADARYQLEGTLRQVGTTIRLTFQLIDANTGARVWDETYDRDLKDIGLLEVQDDITDRVVASVADPYGGLMRDLFAGVTLKAPEDMTAYEAILRHFIYRQRIGADDHLATRSALEHAVELEPGNADAWAALALIYNEEYKHDYNRLPHALDRALKAARRALELEPDNSYANFALAESYFFRQDVGAFRAAAERAISLNPRDSDSMAMIGIMMGYSGDWEHAIELTTRAMELNPNHPGWYRFSTFFDAYRKGNYEQALDIAQRINMPEYFADAYARAIAHARLGHQQAAAAALNEFLALWPGDFASFREKHLGRWMYAQPELAEQVTAGLKLAGLEVE